MPANEGGITGARLAPSVLCASARMEGVIICPQFAKWRKSKCLDGLRPVPSLPKALNPQPRWPAAKRSNLGGRRCPCQPGAEQTIRHAPPDSTLEMLECLSHA